MNTSLEIIRSAGTDHLCYRVEKDTFVAVHNQMLSFTEMEDEFEIVPTDKSYRDKLYIYQGQAVRLVPQIYHNGWLALCLELADTEEPYTILTVNLEEMDAIGLPDKAFIDINNNLRRDGVSGFEQPCYRYRLPERQRMGGVPDGTRQSAACLPALSGIVQSHQYLRIMFPINKPNV